MLEKIRPTPDTLIKWRKRYNYSQQELANHLKQSLEQIQKWEDGTEKIPISVHLSLHDPDFIW